MPVKKTLQEFKNDVLNVLGPEYKVIDNVYINNKTPILMKHLKCGFEYKSRPHDILNKHNGCPKCSGNWRRTLNEMLSELPDGYEYIEGYKGYKQYCTFKHLKCGTEFKMEPSKLNVYGRRCPKCGGTMRKTHSVFINEIETKFLDFDDYTFLDEYVNDKTKLRIKHIKCNNVFRMTPYHFLRGERCPYCHHDKISSNGEKIIERFLTDNEINYKRECKFKDLKYQNRNGFYKFDFYIKDLNLILEFDGEQHFKPWRNYSIERLKQYHETDLIKNDWVVDHEISLIRIKYTNFKNLKEILRNILIEREKSSETIEKHGLFYISEDSVVIKNNKEYYSDLKL